MTPRHGARPLRVGRGGPGGAAAVLLLFCSIVNVRTAVES
ncbi:hypothetical protein KCH_67890 [Kitasatospora cheerisanensis KCTC 2395]|uniref:Uncharacterized protein n=1 Tax=Kitasatospora cheerisanensis KCTC 2395 TaxID=1348663 RepID=A0A066YTY8_9ACTN|nr:hypothetical protein KCH_67890 [Kitasatospora cheerisanensis KCTC 2395]